jgi:hypothetical protein
MAFININVGGSAFRVGSRYAGLKIIGRGSLSYGVVVSCTGAVSTNRLAIKRIKPMSAHTSDSKHVLREIRCMRLLGAHVNVVSICARCNLDQENINFRVNIAELKNKTTGAAEPPSPRDPSHLGGHRSSRVGAPGKSSCGPTTKPWVSRSL